MKHRFVYDFGILVLCGAMAQTVIGETSLHFAVKNGTVEQVKLLVTQGARLEAKDHEGATPLHHAAVAGRAAMVTLLLDRGAGVDTQDWEELTPLHWAAYNGRLHMVKQLLEAGANVNAMDYAGRTARACAVLRNHGDVVSLLERHGGNQ